MLLKYYINTLIFFKEFLIFFASFNVLFVNKILMTKQIFEK